MLIISSHRPTHCPPAIRRQVRMASSSRHRIRPSPTTLHGFTVKGPSAVAPQAIVFCTWSHPWPSQAALIKSQRRTIFERWDCQKIKSPRDRVGGHLNFTPPATTLVATSVGGDEQHWKIYESPAENRASAEVSV